MRASFVCREFPIAQPYKGLPLEAVVKGRASLHPCHKLAYRTPLMIVEGKGQYLFDEKGKRYLDLFGGVCTVGVGHCHPRVVAAAVDQLNKINHTTSLYYNPVVVEYMEALRAHLPKGEEWVFHFTNSGSEATDFALLSARCATKNSVVVTLRNSYHGMTEGSRGTVAVPGWKHPAPSPNGMVRTLSPIEYRGVFGDDVKQYVDDLKDVIMTETPNAVAAFIAERIQGVGGLYPLLPRYLPDAYAVVRAAGGLCIADEVQTGFGRLGTCFWGFNLDDVVPDIIVCAKSIGNGAPVGAVIMKRAVSEAIKDVSFFNTYGGNPVSMAMALANLRVIEEEGLQAHASKVGAYNIEHLKEIMQRHPSMGSVRGSGFIIGIELVNDKITKEPLTKESVANVMDELRERGIIVGKGGKFGNVLRLQGPMCATIEDIAMFHKALDESLTKLKI